MVTIGQVPGKLICPTMSLSLAGVPRRRHHLHTRLAGHPYREGVDERSSRDRIHWHIANGSPCVVPSWDKRDESPTNKSVGSRYVLMRTFASDGQRYLAFCRATCPTQEGKERL